MSGFMDLSRPRVARRSDVGLVLALFSPDQLIVPGEMQS